jgi:hypothetical protein
VGARGLGRVLDGMVFGGWSCEWLRAIVRRLCVGIKVGGQDARIFYLPVMSFFFFSFNQSSLTPFV